MSNVNNFSTPETSTVALVMESERIWSKWANDLAEDAIYGDGSPFDRLGRLADRYRERLTETANPCYPGGLHDGIVRAYLDKVEWRELASFFYNRAARNHNRDTVHVCQA